jgi:hypothetical protein
MYLNNGVQVFCTVNGWTITFPMTKENNAHEAISLLFQKDGAPNGMVMDGEKAQVEGEFRCMPREAECYINQTEPHTQRSNAIEGSMRELK